MSLRPTYGISRGFYGEEITDSDGEVTFSVPGWTTYTVWVDHKQQEEIKVGGEDETFEFDVDNDYEDWGGDEEQEDSEDDD